MDENQIFRSWYEKNFGKWDNPSGKEVELLKDTIGYKKYELAVELKQIKDEAFCDLLDSVKSLFNKGAR